LLVILAAPVGAAQSMRDWSAAARPRRTKRCCPVENHAALRHNFDRERIAQTETKEVDLFGSSCKLCCHGNIRRKHSDERGRNFMT
jgi:hypothetical protein